MKNANGKHGFQRLPRDATKRFLPDEHVKKWFSTNGKNENHVLKEYDSMSSISHGAILRQSHSESDGIELDKTNPLHPSFSVESTRPDHHGPKNRLNFKKQREVLLSLRARLMGNAAKTADLALSGSMEATSASPDTADLASEIEEQEVALTILGSTEETLDHIEAALQRVEDGTYGRCMECQMRIPAARLEVIPYATCCVRCASRREQEVAKE